jgi:uncharacterized RDD family membrane protein YckC
MATSPTNRAGLARRLGAALYDALLLLALAMIATLLFLPFTGGEALTPTEHPLLERLYQFTLCAIFVGYFGYCWTRSGQSIGMLAWRLRVEREDGRLLTWRDSVLRVAAALVSALPAGLGYAWSWLDPDRRTWHDRWTRTRVVVLPKRPV